MKRFPLAARLRQLFGLASRDEEFFEELEDILIEGDIGPVAAAEVVGSLKEQPPGEAKQERERILAALRDFLGARLRVETLGLDERSLNLFLVLGVNGVGKTTTIAKLAHYFQKQGKNVLLAAADTFRAAAIDQIGLWGRRLGVPVIRQDPGSDPGAVVFDAISSAEARKADLVLVDTAGRMHNKAHLVRELAKIDRIVRNRVPARAYKKVLIIDATTGQNAVRQAEVFQEAVGVDSVVLAKYDSTAKGGIAVSISSDLGIPISFMGTGQGPEDLLPFDRGLFLDSLVGGQ